MAWAYTHCSSTAHSHTCYITRLAGFASLSEYRIWAGDSTYVQVAGEERGGWLTLSLRKLEDISVAIAAGVSVRRAGEEWKNGGRRGRNKGRHGFLGLF